MDTLRLPYNWLVATNRCLNSNVSRINEEVVEEVRHVDELDEHINDTEVIQPAAAHTDAQPDERVGPNPDSSTNDTNSEKTDSITAHSEQETQPGILVTKILDKTICSRGEGSNTIPSTLILANELTHQTTHILRSSLNAPPKSSDIPKALFPGDPRTRRWCPQGNPKQHDNLAASFITTDQPATRNISTNLSINQELNINVITQSSDKTCHLTIPSIELFPLPQIVFENNDIQSGEDFEVLNSPRSTPVLLQFDTDVPPVETNVTQFQFPEQKTDGIRKTTKYVVPSSCPGRKNTETSPKVDDQEKVVEQSLDTNTYLDPVRCIPQFFSLEPVQGSKRRVTRKLSKTQDVSVIPNIVYPQTTKRKSKSIDSKNFKKSRRTLGKPKSKTSELTLKDRLLKEWQQSHVVSKDARRRRKSVSSCSHPDLPRASTNNIRRSVLSKRLNIKTSTSGNYRVKRKLLSCAKPKGKPVTSVDNLSSPEFSETCSSISSPSIKKLEHRSNLSGSLPKLSSTYPQVQTIPVSIAITAENFKIFRPIWKQKNINYSDVTAKTATSEHEPEKPPCAIPRNNADVKTIVLKKIFKHQMAKRDHMEDVQNNLPSSTKKTTDIIISPRIRPNIIVSIPLPKRKFNLATTNVEETSTISNSKTLQKVESEIYHTEVPLDNSLIDFSPTTLEPGTMSPHSPIANDTNVISTPAIDSDESAWSYSNDNSSVNKDLPCTEINTTATATMNNIPPVGSVTKSHLDAFDQELSLDTSPIVNYSSTNENLSQVPPLYCESSDENLITVNTSEQNKSKSTTSEHEPEKPPSAIPRNKDLPCTEVAKEMNTTATATMNNIPPVGSVTKSHREAFDQELSFDTSPNVNYSSRNENLSQVSIINDMDGTAVSTVVPPLYCESSDENLKTVNTSEQSKSGDFETLYKVQQQHVSTTSEGPSSVNRNTSDLITIDSDDSDSDVPEMTIIQPPDPLCKSLNEAKYWRPWSVFSVSNCASVPVSIIVFTKNSDAECKGNRSEVSTPEVHNIPSGVATAGEAQHEVMSETTSPLNRDVSAPSIFEYNPEARVIAASDLTRHTNILRFDHCSVPLALCAEYLILTNVKLPCRVPLYFTQAPYNEALKVIMNIDELSDCGDQNDEGIDINVNVTALTTSQAPRKQDTSKMSDTFLNNEILSVVSSTTCFEHLAMQGANLQLFSTNSGDAFPLKQPTTKRHLSLYAEVKVLVLLELAKKLNAAHASEVPPR